MTNSWTDIKNTDLVVIMGGNAAEAHPCGFKWVTEAKANRGAKLIVVDPRYTRSAAVSDFYAPIRQGTDIAYVDFSQLKSQAIQTNAGRTSVTVTLPKAQLEPAVLNVSQSYVYAEQQGLFNRIGNFFSGNPNSQQQVYQIAEQKIETAAKQSPLLTQAQKNTEGMLDGMLSSLGFTHVTVTFAS